MAKFNFYFIWQLIVLFVVFYAIAVIFNIRDFGNRWSNILKGMNY